MITSHTTKIMLPSVCVCVCTHMPTCMCGRNLGNSLTNKISHTISCQKHFKRNFNSSKAKKNYYCCQKLFRCLTCQFFKVHKFNQPITIININIDFLNGIKYSKLLLHFFSDCQPLMKVKSYRYVHRPLLQDGIICTGRIFCVVMHFTYM